MDNRKIYIVYYERKEVSLMNPKLIKILGMVATVIGCGVTLVSNWVSEQNMKQEVKDEVERALSERETDQES